MRSLGLFLGFDGDVLEDGTMAGNTIYNAHKNTAPTNPALLGGVYRHADDLTVGTVTSWPNRVSGGTSATGVAAPACAANFGTTNQKAVTFNGTTQFFTDNDLLPVFTQGQSYTCWALIEPVTSGIADRCVFGAKSAGAALLQYLSPLGSGPAAVSYYAKSNTSVFVAGNSPDGHFPNTKPRLIVWRVSGNSQTDFIINGRHVVPISGARPSSATLAGGMAMTAAYIGCANGAANFFSGKIRACGAHPLWLPILPETQGGPSLWGIYNQLGFIPKKVICDGNSITYGVGGTAYPTQMSALLNPGFEAPVNLGVSACETRDMYSHLSAYVLGAPAYSAANASLIAEAGATFLIAWECTNDLYYQIYNNTSIDPTVAANTAYARWITYVKQLRDSYPFARIVTSTILKRGGAGAWANPTNGEIARQQLNALLLANPGTGVNIVDIAADPAFQDTTNVTYFSDGTHPTTAGYAIVATYFANYLNAQ